MTINEKESTTTAVSMIKLDGMLHGEGQRDMKKRNALKCYTCVLLSDSIIITAIRAHTHTVLLSLEFS